MQMAAIPLVWRLGIFFVAGVAAGISNGIAGGGQFIVFPTMLAMGIPALQANISSSVAVVPSFVGGMRSFRHQLIEHRALIGSLMPSSLLGAATGCTLLLVGSPSTFRGVVPWLIGAATILFALAPLITRRLAHIDHSHPARRWALFTGVFAASVYGGYFGAGLGVVLLAILAISLPLELSEIQGLRIVLSVVVSIVAAAIFILHGHLAWPAVWTFMGGTLIGGWLGTLLILRLSSTVVRALVIAVGVVTTLRLALSM